MSAKIGTFNMSEDFEVPENYFSTSSKITVETEQVSTNIMSDDGFDIDDFEICEPSNSIIEEIKEGMQTTLVNTCNQPIYLGDDYIEEGILTISSNNITQFYTNALQLDKKDIKTFITFVACNNYCLIYSLSVGIELYAVFGCSYPNNIPLVFSVPINKILKLLNTDEDIKFTVTEDELFIEKSKLKVNIPKPNTLFIRECQDCLSSLYRLYETPTDDNLDNTALLEMLTVLNTYSKFNSVDRRIIMLDSQVAYVKGAGYYVFQKFITNKKYILNPMLAQLLTSLCKNSGLEQFEVRIIVNEDVYTILSNNYVLNFPIREGEFKFTLHSKIHPTTVFNIDKKAFKTALNQLDLYMEKSCAITLGETVVVQNKTVQGTAIIEVPSEKREDIRQEKEDSVYQFDYNKLQKVISPIKSETLNLMECNTKEHLYITDDKASYYIIFSVK